MQKKCSARGAGQAPPPYRRGFLYGVKSENCQKALLLYKRIRKSIFAARMNEETRDC